ncbi:oxidoreductase [Flavobacterium cyanobacteriorum]|uniref:Oxidoreductase n=1 Tax=Flavobacterium cyanobacteriorum TaxID=2022802 RepID=A0A255Z547_9FLAO|nr:SDR family oxidoreductase [Flavobacterium cyanobacteriorum]OYQ36647.1 oxidoreductase [Flavobacterium cyanobacteriorum]
MESKTYLFAGASSAMAVAAATLLRQQGHTVIGLSAKTPENAYNRVYTVSGYDFNAYPVLEEPVDGIVYFPGTINLKPFNRYSKEDFVQDYNINALGAAAFAQAYLPNLKKSSNGSIVFISTVAVAAGMPFHSSIAMAKAALEGLTRSLAAELAPKIRVNCIAPSLTDTPLSEKFLGTPEKRDAAQNRNPAKKIGTPQDLAAAIAFLLSSQSAWITGQVLAVDGGMNNLKV